MSQRPALFLKSSQTETLLEYRVAFEQCLPEERRGRCDTIPTKFLIFLIEEFTLPFNHFTSKTYLNHLWCFLIPYSQFLYC